MKYNEVVQKLAERGFSDKQMKDFWISVDVMYPIRVDESTVTQEIGVMIGMTVRQSEIDKVTGMLYEISKVLQNVDVETVSRTELNDGPGFSLYITGSYEHSISV